MKCLMLLLSTMYLLSRVSGNTDIQFAGFDPDITYTYYTNGVNTYTQLTCTATSNSYTVINATWIDASRSTDTNSDVLRFEDIATEVVWGDQRDYSCRAFYQTDSVMYQDSNSITVRISYNTTITVSYGDVTHIRVIDNRNIVYILVMTENVIMSCDADMALWNYNPTGELQQTNAPNPITIDLFTIQYDTTYSCTDIDIYGMRVIVQSVRVRAYGSGVYKQQQDRYTLLTEGEYVYITEETTLVCVTSTTGFMGWFYSNASTGGNERITEGSESTEVIATKGFLKLNLQTTSRTGNYYCQTIEVTEDTHVTRTTEHNVIVSVSIVTTTTSIPTVPVDTTPITTPRIVSPSSTTATTTITATYNYTQISYTFIEDTTNVQISVVVYVVVGLLLFCILLVSVIVVCSVLLVGVVLRSKKTDIYKYAKNYEETAPPTNTISGKKEYISLSDVHIRSKIQHTQGYEPMTSLYPHHKEYVPLEVTTPPNYCEIPESHFESERGIRDTKYENLANVISS